jgi:ABC-2 type transport system permease protein
VLALTARLIRRGSLILCLVAAGYVVLEIVSYLQAYPDAASRARLASFQDNPSVRMLQGVPHDVDTIGGFVAWDGGWVLETVAAIWALLTVVRLTRGDEESDRSALVHLAPLTARRVLVLQLTGVCAAAAAVGASCGAALVAFGVPPGGAGLFSLGLAGFLETVATLAAVASQVFELRRRALGGAASLLAAVYLVRMAGNSTDSLSWLRWFSPYGWMDELQPYGDTRWAALGLLLAVPVLLLVLATALRTRRDLGGGLLRTSDSHRPSVRLLRSTTTFTWRCSRTVLLAWGLGLGAYAALIGSLLPTMTDYLLEEPSARKALEAYGISTADITRGTVSFMSVAIGLALALFGCWRIGAARAEESSGRADLLLVRPVTRRRWLGGHVLTATVSVGLLATTTGLCLWAGARVAGSELSLSESVRAMWNTVPAVLVLVAVAVVLLGLRPRVTVPLSAGVAGASYLLPVIGRALSLPAGVLDLSPFQHLAAVPMNPYAATSGVVMVLVAAILVATGAVGLSRRDLTGA